MSKLSEIEIGDNISIALVVIAICIGSAIIMIFDTDTQITKERAVIVQKDATRNSLQMHVQSLYSQKELHGKSQAQQHDMIIDNGENWNNMPDGFKCGRNIIKVSFYDIETFQ